jgi:hypothetical protein
LAAETTGRPLSDYQNCVFILVGRGAAAEEFQDHRAGIANLMPGARRNRNRIPRTDRADLIAHPARARPGRVAGGEARSRVKTG